MNTPYVVVGLGKTGFACAQFLKRQQLSFSIMDTRLDPPMLEAARAAFPMIDIHVGGLKADLLSQAKTIILSPGLSMETEEIQSAIKKGVEVCGDIELFIRFAKAPIVAVTGTNGKSTLVSLLGEMCNAANIPAIVAGNIGTCVLDVLEWPTPSWYILELSSFQLETTYSLKAAVATILNVTDDHMDRYDSIESYAKAKARIYNGAKAIVYNAEDPLTHPQSSSAVMTSFTSLAPEATQYGLVRDEHGVHLHCGADRLLSANQMKISGLPNYLNALCALAMGDFMGLPRPAMVQGLQRFAGLPHRLQWIKQVDGVDWYNDSKGTNVGASVQAVKGLASHRAGKLILIAGGQGKGADFSPMRHPVESHCRAVILMGEDADKIAKALQPLPTIHRVNSLDDAVQLAKTLAKPNDAVVLSPACASFDMFDNFEHRGDCFMKLVRELA